jgi:NAD(P)-dependent dehydrogenase (short-subunit alcohol dehydrogenase family)
VVTISSFMHRRGSIDFDDLQSERSYGRYAAYGRGKLANLLFTRELERRLRAAGAPTIAVAAHPGFTRTELQRHHRMVRLATKLLGQSAAAGARPTLYAATAPGVRGGDYYGPSGFVELRGGPKKVGMSRPAQDDAVAARLWEVSEALTGVAASLPA